LRATWATYYENTHAVIFVIDSSDKVNNDVSKREFDMILQNEVR